MHTFAKTNAQTKDFRSMHTVHEDDHSIIRVIAHADCTLKATVSTKRGSSRGAEDGSC